MHLICEIHTTSNNIAHKEQPKTNTDTSLFTSSVHIVFVYNTPVRYNNQTKHAEETP